MKYTLTLCGCDDTTRIPIDISESEKGFVEKLCALSEKCSGYSCQPTMELHEGTWDSDECEYKKDIAQ